MTPEEKEELREEVIAALQDVYDPEIPVDIYKLGLIYNIDISDTADVAKPAPYPTARDLKNMTKAGSYLAARHASVDRDASAASAFYRAALRLDPKNNDLLDRAFISSLSGPIDEPSPKISVVTP